MHQELTNACENYFSRFSSLLNTFGLTVELKVIFDPGQKQVRVINKGENNYTLEVNVYLILNDFKNTINAGVRTIVFDHLQLETPRLIIRHYQKDDINDVFEITSNPNVALSDGYKPDADFTDFQYTFNNFLSNKGMFALVSKEDNKVVGGLSLRANTTRSVPCFEIGYHIHEDYWRQGLAYEATHAVIDFMFNELFVEMFTCSHFEDNNASRGLINKLGFKLEGTLRNSFYHTAYGSMDLVTYSLLKDEFI